MQINRLFEIVYILLDKKNVTAGELAEHFEVSKRTIFRDIDTLSSAGIPVYTAKGKGGGISILDNFVLNKTAISEEEQDQILISLQSLASTRHVDAGSTLSKLGALFQKTDTAWIEVDFSRWGNGDQDKEKFEQLKNAVIKKLPVSFTYPGVSGEITDRTVYPVKLIFKSKAWYVQAYCLSRRAYRTFKINRILHLKVLPDSFLGQEIPSPPTGQEETGPDNLISLKLLFSPRAAYRIYDEFNGSNVIKNEDGSFTVTVYLPEDSWLYGFLLSFGADVRVMEPRRVKENLLAQIEAIKESYLLST